MPRPKKTKFLWVQRSILLYIWDLKWIWLHTPSVTLEVEKMRRRSFKHTEKSIFLYWLSVWRSQSTSLTGFFVPIYPNFQTISTYVSIFWSLWNCKLVCRAISSTELRISGRCPLTPEEAGLVLAGLGFKHRTYIYLAGSQIYGGNSRMRTFTDLYPNLVTKETLLTPSELEPFQNFSSQV